LLRIKQKLGLTEETERGEFAANLARMCSISVQAVQEINTKASLKNLQETVTAVLVLPNEKDEMNRCHPMRNKILQCFSGLTKKEQTEHPSLAQCAYIKPKLL
jgi:hypothetical protein